jgi:DNA-binding GntR family transcriptional regulator
MPIELSHPQRGATFADISISYQPATSYIRDSRSADKRLKAAMPNKLKAEVLHCMTNQQACVAEV